jgi:hypothetical protein
VVGIREPPNMSYSSLYGELNVTQSGIAPMGVWQRHPALPS